MDHREGLGTAIDDRVVDAATAASWAGADVARRLDSLPSSSRVTVCVMAHHIDQYFAVALARGARPVVVTHTDLEGLRSSMNRLDQLWKGGHATVDASFACPDPRRADLPGNVSNLLPTGATAAILCTDGSAYYPPQVLTASVDSLA